jgi:hypothetical protein
MLRIIGTIVGAIVAVSLAITSVGSIVATLKRRPRSAVRRD